jgi:hypothetical protein
VSERLTKFAVMLIVAPFAAAALLFAAFLVLFLPIVALIAPSVIKFRGER